MAGLEFKPNGASVQRPQNTPDTKPKAETQTPPVEESAGTDQELEEAYINERSVTIALVTDYSLYRKVNDKTLPKRVDYIGSSFKSSRVLAANKGEIEAYFPNILGIAPNNPQFITRVKQYLNNIMIKVDSLGKTFNNSFHYYHKKDYYRFKAAEDAINAEFNKANRSNLISLRKALTEKIDRLNALESEQYKYGYPIDIEDYLMYRHCLLYNDIAKDMTFINVDSNVRFYFKDNVEESKRAAKAHQELIKARANFVSCISNAELFEAVYIQYCLHNNLPVMPSLAEERIMQEEKLDKFSTNEPVVFNRIFANKDITTMALIEKLIARGELIRLEHNQNITTPTGEMIGANIKEAIAWFKNPDNVSAVNAYKTKLQTY